MTDDVRAVRRPGSRRWSPARAVAAAGLVLVTAVGCGPPAGPDDSGAAPATGSPSAGGTGGAGGATARATAGATAGGRTGAGSSPAEPIPLGESRTVKAGLGADFEWEVTVTGLDTTTFTEPAVGGSGDEPCVAVLGTATLVAKGIGDATATTGNAPVPFLVGKDEQPLDPGVCRPTPEDVGYATGLDISAKEGETVEFAAVHAAPAEDAVAVEVVDSIAIDDGGGVAFVYFAIR